MNRMRTMHGVSENILGMPSERVSDAEEFIRSLTANDHLLVVELNDTVVGCAGLSVSSKPRACHSGTLGIMVHADYQRQGIGGALMTAILDIADNWLKLKRVELCVFVENEVAIALYRKLGFVVEGTKKYAAIRNGIYTDEYLMARYGTNENNGG
ncbi:MAG: GNAT family N-acetyltransferase [Synergistaceae bacterium]|nr:GNAT family N-acetyltransferase [Synergistaceae bacterium]